MSSTVLLRRLERLEIPECECPRWVMPACLAAGRPCNDYCAPGRQVHGPSCLCDCPLTASQCEHTWHADDPFWETPWAAALMELDLDGHPKAALLMLRRWSRRLWAADSDSYIEPEAPPRASSVSTQAAMVSVMDLRHRDGWSLRHPGDLRRDVGHAEVEVADGVGIGTDRLTNGLPSPAAVQGELQVYDPGPGRELPLRCWTSEQIGAVLWWDVEEDLLRLVLDLKERKAARQRLAAWREEREQQQAPVVAQIATNNQILKRRRVAAARQRLTAWRRARQQPRRAVA